MTLESNWTNCTDTWYVLKETSSGCLPFCATLTLSTAISIRLSRARKSSRRSKHQSIERRKKYSNDMAMTWMECLAWKGRSLVLKRRSTLTWQGPSVRGKQNCVNAVITSSKDLQMTRDSLRQPSRFKSILDSAERWILCPSLFKSLTTSLFVEVMKKWRMKTPLLLDHACTWDRAIALHLRIAPRTIHRLWLELAWLPPAGRDIALSRIWRICFLFKITQSFTLLSFGKVHLASVGSFWSHLIQVLWGLVSSLCE